MRKLIVSESDLVDELHLLLYPLAVGGGKRLFPAGVNTRFAFKEAPALPERRGRPALRAAGVSGQRLRAPFRDTGLRVEAAMASAQSCSVSRPCRLASGPCKGGRAGPSQPEVTDLSRRAAIVRSVKVRGPTSAAARPPARCRARTPGAPGLGRTA